MTGIGFALVWLGGAAACYALTQCFFVWYFARLGLGPLTRGAAATCLFAALGAWPVCLVALGFFAIITAPCMDRIVDWLNRPLSPKDHQ